MGLKWYGPTGSWGQSEASYGRGGSSTVAEMIIPEPTEVLPLTGSGPRQRRPDHKEEREEENSDDALC
jgi:hypothetical protein